MRSKTEEDAVVRLQSNAIVRGLGLISSLPVRVLGPDLGDVTHTVPKGACVLFHYDDVAAAKIVKSIATFSLGVTFGCLASDVYTFDPYLDVHEIVDFYLAPTRMHRLVLMSQLYKPVYLLPECIDPSALSEGVCLSVFPIKQKRRLVWFGYPESFEKSMVSLVPVIEAHEHDRTIDSFSLISNAEKFHNRFGLTVVAYRKADFAKTASSFDYCLLSHFSLDLAVNSLIKSPNKLVTALFLGLIPLASRTPSYADLLTEFGLDRFLYDSPVELHMKLRNLDPIRDSEDIRKSGILESLRERYSDASIASEFLQIASKMVERDTSFDLTVRPSIVEHKTPEVQIKDHISDFFPSLWRGFQWRFGKR